MFGAHPIKLIVTSPLPDRAINGISQARIERYLWTFNWFSEPYFKTLLLYFNLLYLDDFLIHHKFPVSFFDVAILGALEQLHTCACNMFIISSFVINWQFRRIDHNGSHKPVSVLSLSDRTYNSHIIKNESFLAYFMRILNSCVVQQVQTFNPRCPPSQSHTFSAQLLFNETFAQSDVFAIVNCPVVTLSVFYSTVLMRGRMFLRLWIVLT